MGNAMHVHGLSVVQIVAQLVLRVGEVVADSARVLLVPAGLVFALAGGGAQAVEVSGYLAADLRVFPRSAIHPLQRRNSLSFAMAPEFYQRWGDGRHSLTVSPFLRVDSADSKRTHFDVREALYWRAEDSWELRAGIGRVFWGVTESRHLVDFINQTDFVEDVDGEDKLGQPMLALTLKPSWGTLDLFVLPGFRERTYPGRRGRLRSEPFIEADAASYESSAEQKHVDYALRWSDSFGDVDLGVSHFIGTSRDPRLVVAADGAGNPLQPIRHSPHYDQVQRSAIDAQATLDAWLLKFEGVLQSGSGPTHVAWVGGVEYTWYGVGGVVVDVGLLAEHLFDGRGQHATQPFENDMFLGVRIAMTDVQSSQLLAGVIVDLDGDGNVFSLEASRRLNDHWRIEVESRIWSGIASGHLLRSLRRDDYIQFRLLRYF